MRGLDCGVTFANGGVERLAKLLVIRERIMSAKTARLPPLISRGDTPVESLGTYLSTTQPPPPGVGSLFYRLAEHGDGDAVNEAVNRCPARWSS